MPGDIGVVKTFFKKQMTLLRKNAHRTYTAALIRLNEYA